jgi:folate-binding protein YgfZ
MDVTALLEALRARQDAAQPLAVADYRGATTVARFGDPHAELAALLNGCGVYDLGFRVQLRITGADRVRWANGMVTNNIRDLPAGQGVYAFLLNPQGHILGDMVVFNQGDALTVETDRSQVEKVAATFAHHIIMDRVEIENLSQQRTALGIAGPNARAVLEKAGIEISEMQPLQITNARCNCDCNCVECTLIRGQDAGEDAARESYEIWLAPQDVYNTWQALTAAGATPVGSGALETRRIVSGVPLYGVDIRERDLPQETGQMRALNFQKGCYVGQEIVERIRSRGNVHRKFTSFQVDGKADIVAGMKIVSGEKDVGEVTSAGFVRTAEWERTIALGYIRREASASGNELTIGTSKATMVDSPPADTRVTQTDDAVLGST